MGIVRRFRTAVIALISAAILIAGLVTAPPGEAPKPIEVHRAQLTSLTLAWPTVSTADPQQLNDAAPAAATPQEVFDDIYNAVIPVVGPIILFGGFLLLVILACPPCAVVNVVLGSINGIFALLQPATAAAAESRASVDPASASEQVPADPVSFVADNAKILGAGIRQSAGLAGRALLGAVIQPFVVAALGLAAPQAIPWLLWDAAHAQISWWTGIPGDISYDYPRNVVPGYVDPTVEAVLTPTVRALNEVAANLTAAGAPKVLEQSLLSAERVGVTALQAEFLVSGELTRAIQNVIEAVSERGDVGAVLGTGVTDVLKAVFGDPDAPDAAVDPAAPAGPTAPSVATLGAVGSVVTSVRQGLEDVGNSLIGGGSPVAPPSPAAPPVQQEEVTVAATTRQTVVGDSPTPPVDDAAKVTAVAVDVPPAVAEAGDPLDAQSPAPRSRNDAIDDGPDAVKSVVGQGGVPDAGRKVDSAAAKMIDRMPERLQKSGATDRESDGAKPSAQGDDSGADRDGTESGD